jgi:hypothetical protein
LIVEVGLKVELDFLEEVLCSLFEEVLFLLDVLAFKVVLVVRLVLEEVARRDVVDEVTKSLSRRLSSK